MRKNIFTVCEQQNIDQHVYLYREYHFLDSIIPIIQASTREKPVFWVSDKMRLKQACSATDTS